MYLALSQSEGGDSNASLALPVQWVATAALSAELPSVNSVDAQKC